MRDRLLAYWPLKLLSLVVASGIWISLTTQDRTLRDFTVPLEVQLDEQRIAATPPPTAVTVRLEGPETAIRRLDPLRLAVRLDLRDAAPGERDVQLSEAHLRGVPPGIDVAFFEPDRFRLTIDRRLRRELPVAPDLVGELAPGYYLYEARVRPEAVSVEGPERSVREMVELRTDPIPLDGRQRSFTQRVGAVPDRPEVRIVDPTPLEVRAVIDLAPVSQELFVTAGVVGGTDLASAASPSRVRVAVSGAPAIVRRLAGGQLRAVADVTGLQPGTHRVGVEVRLLDLNAEDRARVRVVAIDPPEVAVRLSAQGERPS
jgi:YbbR domain-containing protein